MDTMSFCDYRRCCAPKEECNRTQAKHRYRNYIAMKSITGLQQNQIQPIDDLSFGDCKPCVTPCVEIPFGSFPGEVIKQEGNNPMYNTKTSTASADITINATKSLSDEMLQRQYLLDELTKMTRWEWQEGSKLSKIKKMFNLDAPIRPKTSAEFLAAITANAYTVNQAKVDAQTKYFAAREDNEDEDDLWAEGITNQYYGITFTSLPVEDRKGYETAEIQYRTMLKTTERTIHIASPADGLAALAAFEAWMPTPATTTVQ